MTKKILRDILSIMKYITAFALFMALNLYMPSISSAQEVRMPTRVQPPAAGSSNSEKLKITPNKPNQKSETPTYTAPKKQRVDMTNTVSLDICAQLADALGRLNDANKERRSNDQDPLTLNAGALQEVSDLCNDSLIANKKK